MNILINRNDNLGDIVYTLQMATLLKRALPNCHVCFLVRDYAKDLIHFASNVDTTLSFESLCHASSTEQKAMLKKFDVFINAKADKVTAKLAKKAGIKMRIGNSHRLYHWFYCNKLINIKRKGSPLHEIQLNTLLLKPLINKVDYSANILCDLIQLKAENAPQLERYLDNAKHNIVCHPGSNGNGREWPIDHYISLIKQANPSQFNFIITGSAKEQTVANQIATQCPQVQNLAGKLNLKEMISLLGMVDQVVVAGTGPLHISAALGTKTIGLFPPIDALDKQRWGPVFDNATNLQAKTRCQSQCDNTNCHCMQHIKPEQVLQKM